MHRSRTNNKNSTEALRGRSSVSALPANTEEIRTSSGILQVREFFYRGLGDLDTGQGDLSG